LKAPTERKEFWAQDFIEWEDQMNAQAASPLAAGVYFPRIARPYSSQPSDSPGWNPVDSDRWRQHGKTDLLAISEGQLHYLKEHFEDICKVVYPCEKNYAAFGHEIRNVLILACTEVEAQWKGILDANGFDFEGQTPCTEHYVQLLQLLKLDKYSVKFPYFPRMPEIRPFVAWNPSKPTNSLHWYRAYNKVKHDREENFQEACLKYAFEAATACFVLLCAQHGWALAKRDSEAVTKFFYLKDKPVWDVQSCYTPSVAGGERTFATCQKYFDGSTQRHEPVLVVGDHSGDRGAERCPRPSGTK
jgi:hypothetical protein